jgi:thiamine-monophosphate kinase
MKEFNTKFTDVNTLGEFGLIEKITEDISLENASSIKGIGDDAAVIRCGDELMVVSTDMLVEGIHFDLMYTPLKHLGYKAVIVNLSDIYAMNALPKQITVSIAFSSKFSVEAIEELYIGIKEACKRYNVDLVGGDTTSSPKGLIISVTAIGVADEKTICYRSGAKKGDIICISGDLGAAYLGLQILEREKQLYISNPGIQPDLEDQKYLLERQLKPEARRDSIAFLKKEGVVPTAMIDISDGLASDLMHICKASNTGAFLEEGKIPINEEAQLMAIKFQLDPITTALSGGEDYELLFTINEKDLEKIRFMPSVYIIGEITDVSDGYKLHTTGGNIHDLKAQGWTHFTKQENHN